MGKYTAVKQFAMLLGELYYTIDDNEMSGVFVLMINLLSHVLQWCV